MKKQDESGDRRIGVQLTRATERLAGVSDSPRLDAELLLSRAIDMPRSFLFAHADDELDDGAIGRLERSLARRLDGVPLAYISGTREFWSMPLMVSPATLVPRPETETLVEQALGRIPRRAAYRVLDLGTGSGAIALALARERPALPGHGHRRQCRGAGDRTRKRPPARPAQRRVHRRQLDRAAGRPAVRGHCFQPAVCCHRGPGARGPATRAARRAGRGSGRAGCDPGDCRGQRCHRGARGNAVAGARRQPGQRGCRAPAAPRLAGTALGAGPRRTGTRHLRRPGVSPRMNV
ncbi:MAG: HemK/PrmC family methyltransferase [Woeseiaceae bacterium]|nr:HemK/PrmC family methyltransferase [Woeseiaceae bacterium]